MLLCILFKLRFGNQNNTIWKINTIKFEIVSPIRKDPNRGMRFIKCNNEPINRGRLGHSKTFLKDIKKPKTYYW